MPKAPRGGRTTAAKPTIAPRPIAAVAHATIGARWRRTPGAARAASLVSAIAKEAIRDTAKRLPIRVVMPVELPTVPEAAIAAFRPIRVPNPHPYCAPRGPATASKPSAALPAGARIDHLQQQSVAAYPTI